MKMLGSIDSVRAYNDETGGEELLWRRKGEGEL